MAFCGKSGVLWSVKAGMTETYYLFLRLCRLILPEMWGRVWGGEKAVRISRNNPAHVKNKPGKTLSTTCFARFYYVSDFLIGHIGFRCPSGVVAVRAVCMDMHSEVERVFARSNLLFGAVGQYYGGV